MPDQNEEIGTVISNEEGPSPSNVSFVVNSGIVHRGQFVEIDFSEGKMVCLVTDVFKTNRYFERAESVKEFEVSGKKLFEQFPTAEWEYLLGQTRPLGVYTSSGAIKRPTYPPSPGAKVKIAAGANLGKFLGFEKGGLNIGEVDYHSLPVELNMSRLLKKHLAVLAMSGSGKSVAVKTIIEEILSRKKEQGRIAILVMDVHGEYTSFGEPTAGGKAEDFSSRTKIVKAQNIRIGVPKLSVGLIASIISGISDPQRRDLEKILKNAREEMRSGDGPFDLAKVKSLVANSSEIKTKDGLLSWLSTLDSLNLFSKTDMPSINDVVKPGQLTVIDFSDLVELKKKQVIVSYFASRLFHDRRAKKVPPFLLVVEEAHNFAPEKTKLEASISKGIIETIAREGRKFGASLCLVSQRPVNLSTTALSQCNTNIILRVTNPYDLKHIGESSEGLDSKSTDMITSLRVGEALLVGEAVNHPVFFRVRKNRSPDSRHEISLEQAAFEFEKNSEDSLQDAAEFLE
ncbi:MAG: ATP-binding protein [archaeon]